MLKDRSWRTGAGEPMLEDRCWRTDAGGPMLEDRCWRTDAEVSMVIMLDDQCRMVMLVSMLIDVESICAASACPCPSWWAWWWWWRAG